MAERRSKRKKKREAIKKDLQKVTSSIGKIKAKGGNHGRR